MRQKLGCSVAALLAFLALSLPGFAQQEEKKLRAASLDGTTGLFKVWDAETLRKGEFNITAGFSHYNRDPGQMAIKTIPLGMSFALHDRIEIFGVLDTQRRITNYGLRTYRILPGRAPLPAQLRSGPYSFNNEAPFVDVQRAMGLGDFRLGVKVNIFSERVGNRFGLAMVAFGKFPTHNNVTYLNRGLGTGQVDAGIGSLLSKRAGRAAQLYLNGLMNFVRDPRLLVTGVTNPNDPIVNLQNEFIYRMGAAFPSYGAVQLITEAEGHYYLGSKTAGANPRSPIDVVIGLRGFLTDNISASLGYRAAFNRIEENLSAGVFPAGRHGWVGQLALAHRRNDPPTVTCSIANASIKQDETTAVRASGVDPENGKLAYTWSASGGKITGSGDSVTFDATGVAPGEYAITATVSDGKNEASCTTRVTVIKKNLPPTVTCSPASATITQGESITIRAEGRDPNNDALKYSWTVNGQALAADGPTVNFGTTGRAPGSYKIAVSVSDGEFSATSSSVVVVREAVKPNRPPVIECLTSSVDLWAGSSVELKARASDPDNDRVSISWSATGGTISGTGENVTLNSTGMKAGIFTVTATADDGRNGRSSCSMTVNVSELIRVVGEGAKGGGEFTVGGTRLDNVAKAILDDLATRMKNDPRLRANIIGYTDGSNTEKRNKKLGEKRAMSAVKYLEKKGVDVSRMTATNGGDNNPRGDNKTAKGRKMNRRVEIELSAK